MHDWKRARDATSEEVILAVLRCAEERARRCHGGECPRLLFAIVPASYDGRDGLLSITTCSLEKCRIMSCSNFGMMTLSSLWRSTSGLYSAEAEGLRCKPSVGSFHSGASRPGPGPARSLSLPCSLHSAPILVHSRA
jgi:hypothetical protein